MHCSENIIIEKIALIKHAQYDRTSMIRHGTPEPQVGGEKFQQHLPAVTSAEQKSPNPTDRNMA